MFKEIYRELFSIKLSHDTKGLIATDEMQLLPSAACQKMLNDFGLVFKALGNHYAVLFHARQIDANPAHLIVKISEIPNDTVFRFILNPDNRGLSNNATNLPAANRPQQIYRILDPTKPTAIQVYDMKPAIFSQEHISASNADLELKILNEKNDEVLSLFFEKPKNAIGFEDRYFCSVDLREFEASIYTFQFWVNNIKDAEKTYFLDTNAEYRGHLAIVEITKNITFDAHEVLPPTPAVAPVDFEIEFKN